MIQNDRFIAVKEVAEILCIGVSTVWLWTVIKPKFPKAVRLSARCTRWSLFEVNSFKADLMAGRYVGRTVGSLILQ